MMGHGKKDNIVYLIDFGLTKKLSENSGYGNNGF